MISGLTGTGLNSIIRSYKPSFHWDAYKPTRSIKDIDCTLEDIDIIGGNEPFSVWDPSNEYFKIVYPDTDTQYLLGSVGDFSDGKVQQYWSSYWTASKLGFAVTAPTSASVLDQLVGTPPDILDSTVSIDTTYVDTDGEAQDSVIELSQNRSGTYSRVLQVLVKSVDGNSPVGNVQIGFNAAAGTRTTSSSTWARELPSSKGWWAVMYLCPSGANPIYITMSFKKDTGRWLLTAPMFYSKWSSMENIVRAPIPRINTYVYERGQYQVYTGSDLAIPVSGWLGMSLVLPDRSISNGHLDYSGAGQNSFAGLFSWESGTYRLRVIMSTTSDHLGVQLDNGGTSFSYLDLGDDWVDFEQIGLVATWGILNGTEYANLYVNGKKYDSTYGTSDWYPSNLAASQIFIGADGDGGGAADCWVSRVMIGRQPLNRAKARMLSGHLKSLARGGVVGEM